VGVEGRRGGRVGVAEPRQRLLQFLFEQDTEQKEVEEGVDRHAS
jgi:hypothetical protein